MLLEIRSYVMCDFHFKTPLCQYSINIILAQKAFEHKENEVNVSQMNRVNRPSLNLKPEPLSQLIYHLTRLATASIILSGRDEILTVMSSCFSAPVSHTNSHCFMAACLRNALVT